MPTPDQLAQQRREEIRREALRHLAERPRLAQLPDAVRRGLSTDIQSPTESEVEAALQFLTDLGFLETIKDPLGATENYRVTASGTLHHERH